MGPPVSGGDRDTLQFWADCRINEIVREVATRWGRLVEVDKALAESERCPDGVPGGEFFYEHVHLRFLGDYEVARAIKRDPRYKPAREGLVWADARRKPGR